MAHLFLVVAAYWWFMQHVCNWLEVVFIEIKEEQNEKEIDAGPLFLSGTIFVVVSK